MKIYIYVCFVYVCIYTYILVVAVLHFNVSVHASIYLCFSPLPLLIEKEREEELCTEREGERNVTVFTAKVV